jgi:hypothetical protein
MTIDAISHPVCANQREPAHLMYFSYIIYQPRDRSMAPFAIKSDSCLVNIIVTIAALRFCLRKYKRLVTFPAGDIHMTSFEGESCGIVIKRVYLLIEKPSFRTVAFIAADLKILSVRIITSPVSDEQNAAAYYQK